MKELKCIEPGAVQDWELEAYVSGEASPRFLEHVKRCPACLARLRKRVVLEHQLRRTLYRFDCPPPDLLRDYECGYAAADEQRRLEAHLETCPHCAAELADLAESVEVEFISRSSELVARAERAAARMGLIVARLISPAPRPVLALRGETREVLLFEAGDMALSVNLEQEENGAYTLFGQVLSPQPIAATDGYARLTAREEKIAPVEAELDANGGFALCSLCPGTYQLVVSLLEQRIVVPTLTLGTEP